MKRLATPILLSLVLAACTTHDVPVEGIMIVSVSEPPPFEDHGGLMVHSYVAPPTGEGLRVRVNGDYLLAELDDGWQYLELAGDGSGIGTWLPAGGYQVDLVTRSGDVVLSTPVLVRPWPMTAGTHGVLWAWGALTAPRHWATDPLADTDPTTDEIAIRNSLDQPVQLERCTGADPGTCEILATIAADGLFVDEITPAGDGARLALRLPGQPATASLELVRYPRCERIDAIVISSYEITDGITGASLGYLPDVQDTCR